MAMTIEQATAHLEELRAKRGALKGKIQQAVIDGETDNKRSALRKELAALDNEVEDAEILRAAAVKEAAAAITAQNRDQQYLSLKDASKRLVSVAETADAVQAAVVALAAAYKRHAEAKETARAAMRTAHVKHSMVGRFLNGSVDLALAVEFARAGISHLSQTPVTGARQYEVFPESVRRGLKKVEAVLDAEIAKLNPAPAPTTTPAPAAKTAA